MHEVRVESLEKLESREGRMLLSANAGSLSIVFPQEVWDDLLANAPTFAEPVPEELEELNHIKEALEGYAEEESFGSVLRDVPCGVCGAARAAPAVSRCRRSCGRCSRGSSAGVTFILLQPGDNLCRS